MSSQLKPTFEVDKEGMSQVFARKGKAFIVTELVQNAWDEDTTTVDVGLEAASEAKYGEGMYRLTVEDDNPDGFADLAHAYTLFAKSAKKSDATKRGRFNLGEKLVIAVCEEAMIATTKGTITFTEKGRMHSKSGRVSGSKFTGLIRLTPEDLKEIDAAVRMLLPPSGIITRFNGEQVVVREPLREFPVTLKTEVADADGNLKRTTRKANVRVYEPLAGETPSLYEMGIPVVELEDRFHISIEQKIPLNTERDNVPPGYLRDVRTAVLNNCHDLLTEADAAAEWVTDAMGSPKAAAEAVATAFHGKFGDKAVIYDPSDAEANNIAMSEGYAVVKGGSLPKTAWANVKGFEIALPAGKVTPSPNPGKDTEGFKKIDPDDHRVRHVVKFAKFLAERLLDADIEVEIVNEATWGFNATYGPRKNGDSGLLTFNVGALGWTWFKGQRSEIVRLCIHELGHHTAPNHLDRDYFKALERLGAGTVELALDEPHPFYELEEALNAA